MAGKGPAVKPRAAYALTLELAGHKPDDATAAVARTS